MAPAISQGPDGVRAAWVMRENQRPGTTAWQIHGRTPDIIAGYADRTYAAGGDTTTRYVSTTAPYWHVEAYRIG